jgi:hypothetical protein
LKQGKKSEVFRGNEEEDSRVHMRAGSIESCTDETGCAVAFSHDSVEIVRY